MDSKLRQFRRRLGLSQSEAAQLVGVSRLSVSRYETGARQLPRPVQRFLRLFVEFNGSGSFARGEAQRLILESIFE
ncbi:MAG: helix-turn-helix domain-containing protein [Verrucomicrobiia bacterium]